MSFPTALGRSVRSRGRVVARHVQASVAATNASVRLLLRLLLLVMPFVWTASSVTELLVVGTKAGRASRCACARECVVCALVLGAPDCCRSLAQVRWCLDCEPLSFARRCHPSAHSAECSDTLVCVCVIEQLPATCDNCRSRVLVGYVQPSDTYALVNERQDDLRTHHVLARSRAICCSARGGARAVDGRLDLRRHSRRVAQRCVSHS